MSRDTWDPWDLVVVGGGTAGIVGAKTAARLGARVLLVERERTGGDCLWTGCVPSKSLLAAASAAATARGSAHLGVRTDAVSVDFGAVMRHVRGAIEHIAPVDSPEALEDEGVTVWRGEARFLDRHRLVVSAHERDHREVRFHQALLATGAAPAVPAIPGLHEVDHLTTETVWDLTELPSRLVVLGGGSVGCELGQAFARLGGPDDPDHTVAVVEGAARLLPREEADAARAVTASLEADGVDVVVGAEVTKVVPDAPGAGTGGCLQLADGSTVPFSHLLVAVGRSPRTSDLGLEAAGVEVDERGFVRVDDRLRTTNPLITAAGDLTGHPQFTHTAGVHGSLAASNAVLGVARKVDLTAVPRVTYTDPEVAAVGVDRVSDPGGSGGPRGTDGDGDALREITWHHDHVDRAVAEGRTGGYTRIRIDRRGRVLGATVVGPRAGETIGELTLAVSQGLRTRDLAGVIHPYPTWNDGAWNAAISDVRDSLTRPTTRRALGALAAGRRWWVGRRSDLS
ncbi:dihydrolipoyl dehydrogenase family protein [Nocardioides sp. GCM10027113]|uniref:dihydrolipoyl dehydrogenase family protein n=1 Tax=unclassified Nocardioides TaxID=2615069 RepID=UPI00361EAAB6